MEWTVRLHKKENFVEIVTNGIADKDSSLQMAKLISETLRKNRMKRVLVDHRNITEVSGDAVAVYNRPKIFRLIGVIIGVKIAEVVNPEHLRHFRFLETVSLNLGYQFSVFSDRKNALEWLLDKKISE
jgi:hypothetical protein